MAKKRNKRVKFTSAQIIPLGFLVVILIGTVLLLLPVSAAAGEKTDFLTALFTATTSVCVTGLTVVETAAHWSLFGKIVILFLIQLGGLGVVAVMSGVILALKHKFTLRDSALLRDSFNLDSVNGLGKFLLKVIRGTFIVEGVGAVLYLIVFIPEFGVGKGIFVSIFTAVSAFCNAGLDVIGPDSLMSYANNPAVLMITMLLIVLGGIGYIVWFDVSDTLRDIKKNRLSVLLLPKRVGEHTKLAVLMTLFLVISGAGLICLFEWNNPLTIGNMTVGEKILNAFFESVTFRTAGFASFPQENLTTPSLTTSLVLMFIGGSPIGTAGGVKTVTIFLVIANAVSFIRRRNETVAFRHHISEDLIRKATAIVTVSVAMVIVGIILLSVSGNGSFEDVSFEVVSALATVGLTRGLTPDLNLFGRILVVILMFLGRIGPISMAVFFAVKRPAQNELRHSDGRFYVG